MTINKKILAALLIPTFIILYIGGSSGNIILSAVGIFLLIFNIIFNVKKQANKKASKSL